MSDQVYRGKVKVVETIDDSQVKITFTDDITAGDGAKKDNIPGKGKLNLDLTSLLFSVAEKAGVPTHTISRESDTVIIAKKLEIIPVEVVVRNIVAGSFARRYGSEDGKDLDEPIVEYFVKDDELHDPLIDESVVLKRELATKEELSLLRTRALQVNAALKQYFKEAGMLLVDFKLEFGKDNEGKIFLGDELSADSMRVWDSETREKLDKDRFRKDLGDVLAGYQVIIDRLEKIDYNITAEPVIAQIWIQPKEKVTNPSGEVTKRALVNSGMKDIGNVTMGKVINVQIDKPKGNKWIDELHDVAKNLLSNPLIEEYSILYSYKHL